MARGATWVRVQAVWRVTLAVEGLPHQGRCSRKANVYSGLCRFLLLSQLFEYGSHLLPFSTLLQCLRCGTLDIGETITFTEVSRRQSLRRFPPWYC